MMILGFSRVRKAQKFQYLIFYDSNPLAVLRCKNMIQESCLHCIALNNIRQYISEATKTIPYDHRLQTQFFKFIPQDIDALFGDRNSTANMA